VEVGLAGGGPGGAPGPQEKGTWQSPPGKGREKRARALLPPYRAHEAARRRNRCKNCRPWT